MPKVLNKYKDTITCDAVYIGRGSQWGNPFKIGQDGTRDQVIEKYKEYFWKTDLHNHLNKIRGKDLVCFCSPQSCHGDFLLKEANKRFQFHLGKVKNNV